MLRDIPGHGPVRNPRSTVGSTLCIATPFFRPSLGFLRSMMRLQRVCTRLGIRLEWLTVRVPLIDIARDELASQFMRSPGRCGDVLLFIDNDETFPVRAVFDAVRLAHRLDVVGVAYPTKVRNWTRVWRAAQQIRERDAEAVLPKVSTETRVAVIVDRPDSTFGRPVECEFLGTGFLAIHRRVFEHMAGAYPELRYQRGAYQVQPGQTGFAFFMPFTNDGVRLAEDLAFAVRWRQLGGQLWGLFWHDITHEGADEFDDDLGMRLGLGLPAVRIGNAKTGAVRSVSGHSHY